MRYMVMHKLDEDQPGAFDPSPEFMERMTAFIDAGLDVEVDVRRAYEGPKAV